MAFSMFGGRRRPSSLFGSPDEGDPQIRMDDQFQGRPPVDFSNTSQDDPEDNYASALMRLTNNRPAMTDYQKQLGEMPKQEDYQPSKMRRLGAVLGGFAGGVRDPESGINTAEGILREPYKQAMGEFSNKLGIRKELAGMEEKNIDDQTKNLLNASTMGINYKKFKLDQSKQLTEAGLKEREFKNTERKTTAEIAKMQKDDYDYVDQADGSILGISKSDPSKRTTIPAHTVSAGQLNAAKMNAESSRITAEAARTNANTGVANERSLQTYRDIMGKAATSRAANSASRLNKPQTAYQQSRAVDLALSLMARDPVWGKYIKKGSASDPEPYLLGTDDGSPMYQQMRKELKRHVENTLTKGSPFPEGGEDNQDDEEIIDLGFTPPRRK